MLGKIIWLAAAAAAAAATGCSSDNTNPPIGPPIQATGFVRTDLVSNQVGLAQRVDPSVVNSWGIATGTAGFWVANNGTGVVSVFDANGQSLSTSFPSSQILLEAGITGIVANTFGTAFGSAAFLVASETGRLWAISGDVNATGGQLAIDASAGGAIYKGLTLATVNGQAMLLAADFHNQRIDLFGADFAPISNVGLFHDSNLPADFSPFNVVAFRDGIYVAYAQQDSNATDEVAGAGLGAIDIYDFSGSLVRRLATFGTLNAPWGMTKAPGSFGMVDGSLLVGNFGDGRITAYDQEGRSEGQLFNVDGSTIAVDGLWGLTFGSITAGSPNVLYFAAGPNAEADGLYGRIEVVP